MAELVRADYDQLAEIARIFERESKEIGRNLNLIRRQVEALEGGDWIGEGARAFYREMGSDVLPSLQRLTTALEAGSRTTQEIRRTMQTAEEECASIFRKFLDGMESIWSKVAGAGWLEWVHGGLDAAGLIPGFGEVADGVNALIYLAEGRHLEAGISAAAMIPVLGDAGKVGKWTVKAGKEVLETAAERGAKEAAEAAVDAARLAGKYGSDGRRVVDMFGDKIGADILRTYDEIADVPGADRLLRDVVSGDATTQGALSEIGYATSLRRQGLQIERVGDVIDGKKAGDILIKDGPVIDVKDIDWTSARLRNPRMMGEKIDELRSQVNLHRERYPGRPIEYAFTDLKSAPPEIVDALRGMGVSVTEVTWIGR